MTIFQLYHDRAQTWAFGSSQTGLDLDNRKKDPQNPDSHSHLTGGACPHCRTQNSS